MGIRLAIPGAARNGSARRREGLDEESVAAAGVSWARPHPCLHRAVQYPHLADRARGAGRVVVAQVLDVQSRFATNRFGDQLIVSTVVLDVAETLKGQAARTLNVDIEGGTVGDLTLKVSDLPSFRPGDRAMFFLDAADGTLVPHDRGRGVLKVSPAGLIEGSAVTLDQVRREVVVGAEGRPLMRRHALPSVRRRCLPGPFGRRLLLLHVRQVGDRFRSPSSSIRRTST